MGKAMENSAVPAYSGLVPMLPVTDVPRTIAFYEQLGFRIGSTHTPDGESAPVWAWLHNGQAHVMINRADGPVEATHHSAALWIYNSAVKAAHTMLESRGLEPSEIGYPPYNAGGEFHVHDPDGYAVFIAHAD
jgi:catechol 2,3-dioxygenase-like lactoylglutathione lyase family enzyme